jgi:hypothetical protein
MFHIGGTITKEEIFEKWGFSRNACGEGMDS